MSRRPTGVVSFERRCLRQTPKWYNSSKAISKVKIELHGSILREGKQYVQVDFANSMVGGGVIGNGSVQEEIMFLHTPELIISRLFTEKLLDNEVLVITGAEQYNKSSGYAQTFKFEGNFKDNTDFDKQGRRLTQVVVMDAHKFPSHERDKQFSKYFIDRELNKAYSAFRDPYNLPWYIRFTFIMLTY